MQNDLISRNALLEKFAGESIMLRQIRQFIHIAPAVDAVEVGSCDGCHWKEIERQQRCSCCRRNRHLKDNYERRDAK